MSGLWKLGLQLVVGACLGLALLLLLPTDTCVLEGSKELRRKEAVLREDLWILRDAIQEFLDERGQYPGSLRELVSAGYIRVVPVDPMTGRDSTWITEDDDN